MVLQPVLLVAAAAALAAAGWRVAGALGAREWTRVVGAVVVAGALAAGTTLLLGVAGLAGAWWAHVLVAAAALAGARRIEAPAEPVPRPYPAALGVLAAVVAWQLARPWLGFDGLAYHLPIPLEWLRSGDAGARVDTVTGFPVGSYPLTQELLLAWALALAGSLVPASLSSPLLAALAGTALWAGLGTLGAGRWVRVAAVAAAITLPAHAAYLGQPGTDVATWAWALSAFALAVAAPGAPALAGLAVLAAGLALGTKTTPALPLLALLTWMLWRVRPPRAVLAGAAGALLVGGLWPWRNLLDHGSPLWPFVTAPWGDPMPAAMAPLADRFIEHPVALLDAAGRGYAILAGGGLVLLAGAATVGLASRRSRPVALLALAAAALWTLAPFTGPEQAPYVALLQVRYLLPAFTVALIAIALSGRDRVAVAVLAAATVTSLLWLADGFDVAHVPSAWVPLVGFAAAPLFVLARLPVLAAALAVALVLAAPGYLERHAVAGPGTGGAVRAVLAAPAWDGRGPIAAGPVGFAALAGERLQHDVAYVDETTPCPQLRRIATTGLLVLQVDVAPPVTARLRGCLAGLQPVHADPLYEVWSR